MTRAAPELSLVIPCYNERDAARDAIGDLLVAFESAGIALQVVACDNGSTDGTGELLTDLASREPAVVVHHVAQNRGYGFGILEALPRCTAPWIGYLAADGQVDAEDVVRLFHIARRSDRRVVAKVRRRFRLDGAWRRAVSAIYNALMTTLWPGIGTGDVNGIPKIVHRDLLPALRLESHDWMIDPELMIKAREIGVPVVELNVLSRARIRGRSHVQPGDILVFLARIVGFRFGGALSAWRRERGEHEKRSRSEPAAS